MCGILSVFCKKKATDELVSKIKQGFMLIKSRGPDRGQIHYDDNYNVLGFHRLCINDMSSLGDQPMVSKNSSAVLMCNGEIYNHKELQKEYGIICQSTSDCEIILKLYEKIGFEETVRRLDGVFAIVLIDKNNVHIARDRVGVRPLFSGVTKDGDIAVASIAKALQGFCNNIEPFAPGLLSFNKYDIKNVLNHKKYTFIPKIVTDPQTDLKLTLIDAVKKRLLTDRPIGCLLSGGLDSSLIASILCRFMDPKDVRTYSIGMEGSLDLKYASDVASFLGTNHTQVVFTPEEGLSAIPEVVEALESYDITTVRASVPMYLLSKYIKEHTEDRVIFSGEGSDELMCGYLYFHFAPSDKELEEESWRLVNDLYKYDVLRADRTVSVHGLELRVPFLDRNFLQLAMSLTGKQKMPINKYEKFTLRYAFKDGDYLPNNVLWRRKDGLSDGCSSLENPWYQYIQEHANNLVSDEEFKKSSHMSKEAMWYKKLFDSYFPVYQPNMYMWMPKWTNCTDPSGRLVLNE